MVADHNSIRQKGWVRLPYQFDATALRALRELNSNFGRGQRLTDMSALAAKLPLEFKMSVSNFGFNPSPLRAVGFNKSRENNWSLPWHQDRVIVMEEKTSHPDYKNWTRKSGVWHCEPPTSTLAQMAFAYIAFDEIWEGQGGLELAEGTQSQNKSGLLENHLRLMIDKIEN